MVSTKRQTRREAGAQSLRASFIEEVAGLPKGGFQVHSARSTKLSKVVSTVLQSVIAMPKRLLIEGTMKRSVIVGISLVVASVAAVGILAGNPERTQAAGGGYVKKCGGGTIFLKEKEKKTFVLHNRVRHNHGLRLFCVHPKLQKAARAHSKDMIERDYYSHDTKGRNESACERVRRYGYNWRACAENIGVGQGASGEPKSMMKGWMNSPDHRRNILNGKLIEIGIGAYTGEYGNTPGVTMYTVDFGSR
jgi:uncharacterized protein YkwD